MGEYGLAKWQEHKKLLNNLFGGRARYMRDHYFTQCPQCKRYLRVTLPDNGMPGICPGCRTSFTTKRVAPPNFVAAHPRLCMGILLCVLACGLALFGIKHPRPVLTGLGILAAAIVYGAITDKTSWWVTAKTCGNCHKSVSILAVLGQCCPHCGAKWRRELRFRDKQSLGRWIYDNQTR